MAKSSKTCGPTGRSYGGRSMIISVKSKKYEGEIDHVVAYEGLISALKHFLIQKSDKNCTIMTDSRLIVKQMNQGWKCSKLLSVHKKNVDSLIEQAAYEGRKIHIQYTAPSKLKPKAL